MEAVRNGIAETSGAPAAVVKEGQPAHAPNLNPPAGPAPAQAENGFALALKNFTALYPDFEAESVRTALQQVWERHKGKAHIRNCDLEEETFALLCEQQFGTAEAPPQEVDDTEAYIEAMRQAMAESQQTYALEKFASEDLQADEGELTAAALAAKYPDSSMVKTLTRAGTWERFADAGSRPLALKLLETEKKCRKWWPGELGVPRYFEAVAERFSAHATAAADADRSDAAAEPRSASDPPANGGVGTSAVHSEQQAATAGSFSSGQKRQCDAAGLSPGGCSQKRRLTSAQLDGFITDELAIIDEKVFMQLDGHLVPQVFHGPKDDTAVDLLNDDDA